MPERLEPEQERVLDLITEPWSQREFVLVQGVAGSGKTTIALHALKHLAENYEHLLADLRITPTLVTYNEYLVRFCHQVLSEFETVVPYLTAPGLLQSGKINILTFRDLCSRLIEQETKERLLSDNECISLVSDIAAKRGVTNLLPSQIYALITSFDILYRDDSSLREEAKNQLKQRLDGEGSDESKKILADVFSPSPQLDTQALVESITQLQEATDHLQLEDPDDTDKIQRDLEYIKKKVEKNDFPKAKDTWKLTRQIVLESAESMGELVQTIDEYWEGIGVETP